MQPALEAIIHVFKAPSSLEKRHGNRTRSPLQVGSRSQKSNCSLRSAFSPKLPCFSPLTLVQKGPALSWLVDGGAPLHSRRTTFLLTEQYVQQHACACCGTLSGLARRYHLPLACPTLPERHHIVGVRKAHLPKPSRYNQSFTACQPTG